MIKILTETMFALLNVKSTLRKKHDTKFMVRLLRVNSLRTVLDKNAIT